MGEENTTSRQDQQRWAEFEPNTAPQVSIESGLETATLIEPDVAQVRPSVQANAGEGSIIQAAQSSAPTGVLRKLGSRKMMLWVGLGILICIAIAVGVSVPLVGDKVNAANASTTSEGPTLVTNTGASPSITSSAATPSSQPSGLPSCSEENFVPGVDWVGIRDGQGWDFELKAVGSAERCCVYCYEVASECNAWLFVRSTRPGPDCTVITGYEGKGPDKTCPHGRPSILFNKVDDKPDNLAGEGPCSDTRRNP